MPQDEIIFDSWLDQYQLIHHLILYSNILMVLQGKQGSGKSTYIKALKHNLPKAFQCQEIEAEHLTSVESVGLFLRQLFSISTIEAESKLSNIEIVEQINKREQHCLLVVDDAHQLKNEVILELFSCLQAQQDNIYFHCLLVGEHSLTARFNVPPLDTYKETFTHLFEMPELTIADTKKFLKQQFSSLGLGQIMKLSDEQIRSIMLEANGNLNALVEQTREILRNKKTTSNKKSLPNFSFNKKVIVSGAAVAFVCVTLLLSLSKSNKELMTEKLNLPDHKQASFQPKQFSEFKNRVVLAETVNLNKPVIKTRKKGYTPLSMIPRYNLLAEKQDKAKAKVSFEKSSKMIEISENDQDLLKGKERVNQQFQNKAKRSNPGLIVPSSLAKNNVTANKTAEKKSQAKGSPLVNSSKPARQKPAPKSNVKLPRTIRTNYGLGKGYGLQFVASADLASAKRFARKYHIYKRANYYQTWVKGKSWYVVVLGDFDTKGSAQQAVKRLPQPLKARKPWVRSIKGLKRIS